MRARFVKSYFPRDGIYPLTAICEKSGNFCHLFFISGVYYFEAIIWID
jgi:hypothetical protein